MDVCQYYKIFWLAVAGAAVGSFANCAASRLAAGEPPFAGRSQCAACGRQLAARDLIPIISFLVNGGKCRFCGGRIPRDCLAAELAGALSFALLGWYWGSDWQPLILWLPAAALLLGVALCDWHGRIIPDLLLLALLGWRVLYFLFWDLPLEGGLVEILCELIVNMLAPALLLAAVLLGEILLESELMGGGDLKLFFVLALYFNWAEQLLILFVGCAVGLLCAALAAVFMQKPLDRALPFGSYLAVACGLVLLWGGPLVDWYMEWF